MITLHTANTPNGQKITIALEELGLDYQLRMVDLNAGEQHAPDFLRISPNNKIPALVDDGGDSMFESCAILYHLATTHGKLVPPDARGRELVLQWLFLQAASIGPMLGQLWWFRHAAPAPNDMALARYTREAKRLYGVIERRLAVSPYIAGSNYTVADIACYPWLATYEELGIGLAEYPRVAAWLAKVGARPAVVQGMRKTREASHV